jgi:hypothetical protein
LSICKLTLGIGLGCSRSLSVRLSRISFRFGGFVFWNGLRSWFRGAGSAIGIESEDGDLVRPPAAAAADLRARTSLDISRHVRSSVLLDSPTCNSATDWSHVKIGSVVCFGRRHRGHEQCDCDNRSHIIAHAWPRAEKAQIYDSILRRSAGKDYLLNGYTPRMAVSWAQERDEQPQAGYIKIPGKRRLA